jgi:hypothetical protein
VVQHRRGGHEQSSGHELLSRFVCPASRGQASMSRSRIELATNLANPFRQSEHNDPNRRVHNVLAHVTPTLKGLGPSFYQFF